MANILKNVDKIITSGPNPTEVDLKNIQAAGGNKIMSISVSGTQSNYYFNHNITFNVSTTTALTGVTISNMSYSIDGATPVNFASSGTGSFTFQENTLVTYSSNPNYTEIKDVVITATDSLGNTESKTMTITFEILGFVATGGVESTYTDSSGQNWKVHQFNSSGNFQVTLGSTDVDYLIVAGGGGGAGGHSGSVYDSGGGGGGAGGFLTGTINLSPQTYLITVAGPSSGGAAGNDGGSGSPSEAFSITATGGGYGLHPMINHNGYTAGSGGSGGGAGGTYQGGYSSNGGSGTLGQGYAGGSCTGSRMGAGGGGATEKGVDASTNEADTDGGDGREFLTGSGAYYSGGGGGGGWSSTGEAGEGGLGGGGNGGMVSNGYAGSQNSGGGGGGGYAGYSGGGGGSGVVIIKYKA